MTAISTWLRLSLGLRKSHGILLIAHLVTLASSIHCTSAIAQGPSIEQLEAAFIYQLTNYIEWADFSSNKEFRIAILGSSPKLTEALNQIAQTKAIQGRQISIRQIESITKLGKTDAIFLTKDSESSLTSTLQAITGKPILTISDSPGLAQRGVMVNFYIVDDKLKYEVNRKSLESSKFKVSSQLLKLARIVDEGVENDK